MRFRKRPPDVDPCCEQEDLQAGFQIRINPSDLLVPAYTCSPLTCFLSEP